MIYKLKKHIAKNRETNFLYTLLCVVFLKKYYWYEIKLVYREKKTNNVIFHWYTQTGFTYQDTILNKREVKKTVSPLHLQPNTPRKLLVNGYLDAEVQCYLGRFNMPLKNYT